MKIEGSVALVTGANRGLGKAIVAALLEGGAAKVYAAARDEKSIVVGSRVVPLTIDTDKPDQIAEAAKQASDVTLLINNAGTMTSLNILTTGRDEIDLDFRTNVFGTLNVIKAFIPVLERANRGATIVNVLSLVSLASFPAVGGYAASKAAAYSITLSMRPELRQKNIDILAVFAGPIDTDMVRALPVAKTSPAEAARGILSGIARGDEHIFPDPAAAQIGALWHQSPKEMERALASF